MRKWKVKLPGGHTFELESDDPGRALLERGLTSFALEEITPPPIVPVEAVAQEGKLTLSVQEAAEELGGVLQDGLQPHPPGGLPRAAYRHPCSHLPCRPGGVGPGQHPEKCIGGILKC